MGKKYPKLTGALLGHPALSSKPNFKSSYSYGIYFSSSYSSVFLQHVESHRLP